MTSFSERKPPTGDRLRQQQETETAEPASAPEESAPLTGASHLPGNGNTRLLQQSLGNAAITRLLSGRTERGRTDPASSQGTAPYPDGGTTMNPRAGLPTSSGSGSASLNSSKEASALLGPIGNRALATVLQRQDAAVDEAVRTDVAGEAAPLLDAAQIADARSYYTSQPWRYTPAIIAQLRGSLGLDAEGGVDAALVLAVAQFQVTDGAGDPALVVDGKAGPRTLPRIFRGGLNVEATGQELGEEVQDEVIDEWASLSTAEARRDRLIELVNERLVAAGVPAVTAAFDANVNNAGSFSFSTWRMEIGRSRLAADTISEEDARDTADTVYHEARHTEQWFRMAQLRAGQGLSAAAITTELFIPARIATAARAAPLARGSMEAVIAQGWWDSVYGSGSAHREAVLAEIDRAATARRLAADLHAANPTAATQAALDRADARFQRAFAAYQNLPEENDAWATGPLAAAGISGGSPEPEPESEAGGPPGEAGEPAGSPPSDEGPAHGTLPEENLPAGAAP